MFYSIKSFVVLLLITFISIPFACQTSATNPGSTDSYAFINVHVIPMDRDTVLENMTVVITGNRITSISAVSKTKLPTGIQEIDGTGKFLMPGLAEMHGHIPGKDQPEYAKNVLFMYIANGVTTVRNMLGNAYHLELRELINKHEVHGPTIFAASPWLSGENINTPEIADKIVRERKAEGFDLLKIGSLDPETYKSMAGTAHKVNMPFGGHVPEAVGLKGALEARQTSIDHYDRYVEFLVPDETRKGRSAGFFGSGIIDLIDRERIDEAIKITVEAGTWNVPTLSLIEHLASEESAEEMITRPEMRYMPRNVLDGWVKFKNDYSKRDDFQPEATAALVEFRRELTKKLHDAGAGIVLGSDAPQFFNVPGFSIHHELWMMTESGLTPYEVLVTGTRNAAEYFGTPEEFGTILPGRRADLILLNSNPLEDISNVQDRAGVMVRGRWYPEVMIQEKLEEIALMNM